MHLSGSGGGAKAAGASKAKGSKEANQVNALVDWFDGIQQSHSRARATVLVERSLLARAGGGSGSGGGGQAVHTPPKAGPS